MNNNIIKYEGEINLVGVRTSCYILEDGTRILSDMGMQDVLKITDESDKQRLGTRLQVLNQEPLKPIIYKGEKVNYFKPIDCHKENIKIVGYEATKLVDICDNFLEARKNINLLPRQKIIADRCETLIKSITKVGIIALIDEATDYQYEREKIELQTILKTFISEDILEWQKTFQLSFYKEIFRLWDIPFTAENIRKKPKFIGWMTNELIYKNIPKGSFISPKPKEKTLKTEEDNWRHKLHKSLTSLGKEELKKIIHSAKTFASVSKTKNKFLRLMKQKYHPERDLPYIDAEAMDDKELTLGKDFDKMLETLLNTPSWKRNKRRK